jgi:hypothetical protein
MVLRAAGRSVGIRAGPAGSSAITRTTAAAEAARDQLAGLADTHPFFQPPFASHAISSSCAFRPACAGASGSGGVALAHPSAPFARQRLVGRPRTPSPAHEPVQGLRDPCPRQQLRSPTGRPASWPGHLDLCSADQRGSRCRAAHRGADDQTQRSCGTTVRLHVSHRVCLRGR